MSYPVKDRLDSARYGMDGLHGWRTGVLCVRPGECSFGGAVSASV